MFRHTSRKLLTCLTALTLTLSAGAFPSWADGAVSGGGEPAVTEQNTDTQGTGTAVTETPAPTEEPTPEPTPEPAPAPSATPAESGSGENGGSGSTDSTGENGTGSASSTTVSSAPSVSADSGASSAASSAASSVPVVSQYTVQIPEDQQKAKAEASALPGGGSSLQNLFGPLWNYGMLAEEITFQSPSQQSNFAAVTVQGDVQLAASQAGGVPLMYRAARLNGSVQMTGEQTAPAVLYLTGRDAADLSAGENTAGASVVNQTEDAITDRVHELIRDAQTISQNLEARPSVVLRKAGADAVGDTTVTVPAVAAAQADQTNDAAAQADQTNDAAAAAGAYAALTVSDKMLIDTAALGDDAVFFFSVSTPEAAQRIADGKLVIRKKKGQRLIFTFTKDAGTEVTLGAYQIAIDEKQGNTSDGTQTELLNAVTDSVVWNLPNAANVTMNGTAGIVFAPFAGTNINLTGTPSSGMLLTAGNVTAGTSLRFMNQSRIDPNGDHGQASVTLGVRKILSWQAGEAPAADQTFRFTLKKTGAASGDGSDGTAGEGTDGQTAGAENADGQSADGRNAEPIETSLTMKASDLTSNPEQSTAEGTASFEPITFSGEGNAVYEITEVNGGAEGVTYDPQTFTVRIDVTADDEGKLTAAVVKIDPQGNEIALDPETDGESQSVYRVGPFTNTFAKKTLKPVSFTIGAGKTLSWTRGMPPVRDSSFAATLKGVSQTAISRTMNASFTAGEINSLISGEKVPGLDYSASGDTQTAVRAADGSNLVNFTYQTAGIYVYTLSEKNSGATGYSYDWDTKTDSQKQPAVYRIEVKVEKNKAGDALVVSKVTVSRNGTDVTNDRNRVTLTGVTDRQSGEAVPLKQVEVNLRNAYRPLPVMYRIPVTKKVEGTAETSRFHFTLYKGRTGRTAAAAGELNGSGEVNLKPAGTVHYSEALAEKYDAKTPHFFFTSPCDEWYRLEEDTNELAPEYVSLNPVWYLHVVVKDYGGQLKSTAVVTNKDGSKQRQIGVWYQAARSGGQNEPDMSRMHIRATITNLYTTGSFSFSKVSSANPDLGLPGAVFKLYWIPIATQGERSGETYQKAAARLKGGQVFDNSGEVADSLKEFKEGTSSSTGSVTFSGLYPDEYYAIVEKTAPAGYQVSANAVVIRTWYSRNSGRVECSVVSSGGFTLGRDGGALKWYDHPITVRIDKIVEGGYLLRGAYMQLLDSNGSVIERWMSGKINPHMVKAQLQLGQTYYIREVQAPAGYNRAESIRFTVESLPGGGYSAANRVQVLKMQDPGNGTKTDGSEIGVNPDTGATAASAGNVRTGDTSPIGLYVLIAAAALAAVIAVIAGGRKKKR